MAGSCHANRNCMVGQRLHGIAFLSAATAPVVVSAIAKRLHSCWQLCRLAGKRGARKEKSGLSDTCPQISSYAVNLRRQTFSNANAERTWQKGGNANPNRFGILPPQRRDSGFFSTGRGDFSLARQRKVGGAFRGSLPQIPEPQ